MDQYLLKSTSTGPRASNFSNLLAPWASGPNCLMSMPDCTSIYLSIWYSDSDRLDNKAEGGVSSKCSVCVGSGRARDEGGPRISPQGERQACGRLGGRLWSSLVLVRGKPLSRVDKHCQFRSIVYAFCVVDDASF